MSIEIQGYTCDVATWQQLGDGGIAQIYEIEKQTWAPWLAASYESLAGRAEVNPMGQLAIVGAEGDVWASLSTNKINWSGDVEDLPSWDEVAGEPTDYSQTYIPDGNSVVLMSMNVSPDKQGLHLPAALVDQLVTSSKSDPSLEHVIGSFRPSDFAAATLANPELEFEEYVKTLRTDGLPVDKWLRALTRMGMTQLAIDHDAMRVNIDYHEFSEFKQAAEANTGQDWVMIDRAGPLYKYWCGETGFFYATRHKGITYQESNVWGELWSR